MCARRARLVRLGASFEGVIRCCHHSRDHCTVIYALSQLSLNSAIPCLSKSRTGSFHVSHTVVYLIKKLQNLTASRLWNLERVESIAIGRDEVAGGKTSRS